MAVMAIDSNANGSVQLTIAGGEFQAMVFPPGPDCHTFKIKTATANLILIDEISGPTRFLLSHTGDVHTIGFQIQGFGDGAFLQYNDDPNGTFQESNFPKKVGPDPSDIFFITGPIG
jgi:hypothetical protein